MCCRFREVWQHDLWTGGRDGFQGSAPHFSCSYLGSDMSGHASKWVGALECIS